MKKRSIGIIALMLAMVMVLTSCAYVNQLVDLITGLISPSVVLTDKALEAEKIIDFKDGPNTDVLFGSDGWSNGDVFNVVWRDRNVHYENGIMRLGITEEADSAWLNDQQVDFNYTAGEARTQNYYHYGDYEVSMKPSANPGTASTFFVCTGPYDLKDGNPNPHDEIDIEFLGQDTTHVQFNFFVDGKGGNEYMYDLGFDASLEFHRYGFRWEENAITWFVDGVPVYKVTTDTTVQEAGNVRIVEKLPSTAGRILTNYWCGNERAWGWMGKYNGETKDNGTQYQWIATSAEGAPLNPPAGGGEETTEINWAEIDAIAPEFPSAEKYVVTTEGTTANITYTDVGGSEYKPVELDVTEAVAGKNYVHLKVTNNGTETVNVRVNMFDPTLTGNNKATNISATMNGESVRTDYDWGGSFFDIPAGETAELVVNFGVGGVKLQLMIDSSRNDAVLRSGDITVSELKFAAVGEVEAPHKCTDGDGDGLCDDCGEGMPTPPAPTPENPTSGDLTTIINGAEFTFEGNVTDGYGVNVDDTNNTIKVTYTNIVGDSYKNFWTNVSSIAGTRTTLSLKVTNNGTADAKFRIDMESQTQTSANTTCCNVSATMNGEYVWTDTEWGGTTFTIPAGQTVEIELVYDASKLPTNVKFMVDSCQYGDSTSHAGEVVLSEIEFKGEYTPSEPTPDPDPTPTPEYTYTDLYVEYKTEDAYTLETPSAYSNSVRITYSEIAQNSWNNVNVWVGDKSADQTRFSMKLTNHGAAEVSVWVQIKSAAGAELVNQNVYIAAGDEQVFVFDFEGTAEMIFFFVDSTHEANAATNAGDITISEIKFGNVKQSAPVDPDPTPDSEYDSLTFVTGTYTITPNNQATESLSVSYENLSGGTYANICAKEATLINQHNSFTMTIKNNGTATVRVRVDIKAENTVGNTNVCNQSSNGGGSWTDLEWGGSFVDVAAGAEVTITIVYDTTGAFGAGLELLVYFDTSTYQDTNVYNGNLTISNFKFATAE